MGYIDLAGLRHVLADGRELFTDVSFRVGEGAKVALVGPNGAGKTTLLRMVAGDLPVSEGAIARSGSLGVTGELDRLGGAHRTGLCNHGSTVGGLVDDGFDDESAFRPAHRGEFPCGPARDDAVDAAVDTAVDQ